MQKRSLYKKRPAASRSATYVRRPHAEREKSIVLSKILLESVIVHQPRVSFEVQWLTLPVAYEVCHEIIFCGYDEEKGCKEHFKYVKVSLVPKFYFWKGDWELGSASTHF